MRCSSAGHSIRVRFRGDLSYVVTGECGLATLLTPCGHSLVEVMRAQLV